jgi:hypothetical protein
MDFSRFFGKSSKKSGRSSPSGGSGSDQHGSHGTPTATAEDSDGFTHVSGGKRQEEAADWFGGGGQNQGQRQYPNLPGQDTSAPLPYALGGATAAPPAPYPSGTLASQVT